MKLYMIRHGQTDANLGRFYAGQSDAKLTERGYAQARENAGIIAHIAFDAVYSSDLSRAHETQRTMLPDRTAVVTPLVREYDVGMLTGERFDDCRQKYGERFLQNVSRHSYEEYGGESSEQIEARAREFLDTVTASGAENVAAFSHGGFIKTVFRCTMGYTAPTDCNNCSVSVFEYTDGRWKMLHWNVIPKIEISEE